MVDWIIERINRFHDRTTFSCGQEQLDNFLKSLVTQYEKRRLGRTFVATVSGDKKVLGFYTAAAGSLALDALPESARKGLPKHPIPTVHLGRLGVDLTCQGKGLGETLLFHFLRLALETSQNMGVHAADLFAISDDALPFYLKYGFIPLEDAPSIYFFP